MSLTFYGLADSRLVGSDLGEVIELFVSREDAEYVLQEVLKDEPTGARYLEVMPVRFDILGI